jgi:hypothetical protein
MTVKPAALPAATGEGKSVTVTETAGPGATCTGWLPVTVGAFVSVAASDCTPTVLKLTPLVKVWTPASPTVKG